jgi:hypothetical protein
LFVEVPQEQHPNILQLVFIGYNFDDAYQSVEFFSKMVLCSKNTNIQVLRRMFVKALHHMSTDTKYRTALVTRLKLFKLIFFISHYKVAYKTTLKVKT